MREEWKHVLQSTWIKVVLIAIVVIPTIYAGVFLGSMWDPYGNAGQMPVAVVNKDKEVQFQSNTLHIGDDLVKNLKESNAMDFQFVNEKKANQGLIDGTYYMVITIPKDFSKHATTLLDKNPEKMVLEYTTNPGTNYIASKMDETAIRTIKENISATITKTYADTIFSQIATLRNGLQSASDGSMKLKDGATKAYDGNKTIHDNLNVLSSSTLTFKNGATSFEEGLQQYSEGVAQVNDGSKALSSGIQELLAKTTQLETGVSALYDGSVQLKNGLTQYTQSMNGYVEAFKTLEEKGSTLNTAILSISQGSSNLQQALQVMSDVLSSNVSDAQKVATIQAMMNGSEQTQGLLASIDTMNKGINSEKGFKNSFIAYQAGISQLYQGAQALQTPLPQLSNGALQVTQGTSQFKTMMPTLQGGIKQLQDGANSLYQGTSALVQNNPTLLSGSSQLTNASSQLYDGATKLAQGSSDLGNGLTQMKDGTTTLSTSLQDGVTKSSIDFTSKTSDMFSQPIGLKHREISNVQSNGKAMAPYMMSVGMYVACMAFTLMYPLLENHTKTRSGLKLWLSKAGVMYTISTIMALLMVACLTLVNGLAPQDIVKTCVIACLISAAFMSMIVFLNVTLGKIGAFLVLIFMVFQLGGAAGTYPIETSNAFFQAIHPYMPFTYSVGAFRDTLALSNSIQVPSLIFGSMIILFSILSIYFYTWYAKMGEERFHQTRFAHFH